MAEPRAAAGAERDPVIVGVGQVNDRTASGVVGLPVLTLIAEAARAADKDSRAALLKEADWLGVVDALSWERRPEPLHPALAEALGLSPRHGETSASPSGNEPVRLLGDAANAIAAGEAEVALIAGGEAMRSMAARRQGERGGVASGTDIIRDYRASGEADLLRRYGVVTPVDVYPFYEQATRAAWGQSVAQANAESGAIWEGLSRAATANPWAWLREPVGSTDIVTPSPTNPMVSYPYTKLMIANSSVNQAAAVILTSAGRARRAGLSDERLIHVGYGAAANEPAANLDRATFHHSPSMQVVLEQALRLNALEIGEIDRVELYSCFPCVPKMARRILQWPLSRPHSLYGGLTFGGGPIGNCMTHAVAMAVRTMRGGGGNALIFANGGFATKNEAIVLTARPLPGGREVRTHDVQQQADRLRGPVPVLVGTYSGPARLETYAVPFARNGEPSHANLLVLTDDGRRCLCRIEAGEGALAALVDPTREPIGRAGTVDVRGEGLCSWTFA